jgi:hypothetical protein
MYLIQFHSLLSAAFITSKSPEVAAFTMFVVVGSISGSFRKLDTSV